MADILAQGTVRGTSPSQGLCKLPWSFDFDDVANTVTVTGTHTKNDDSPVVDPQVARLTIVLNTSLDATVDLLTGKLVAPPALAGQDFSQSSPGEILNAG